MLRNKRRLGTNRRYLEEWEDRMQRFDPVIGVALAALFAIVLSACSVPHRPPVARWPPLAPATTTGLPRRCPRRRDAPRSRRRRPRRDALWTFGHWDWNGAKYIWAPGRYIERPTPTANWRPGYWEQQPDGWIWVDGQWTS